MANSGFFFRAISNWPYMPTNILRTPTATKMEGAARKSDGTTVGKFRKAAMAPAPNPTITPPIAWTWKKVEKEGGEREKRELTK